MKKLFMFLFASIMLLSLVACTKTTPTTQTPVTTTPTTTTPTLKPDIVPGIEIQRAANNIAECN